MAECPMFFALCKPIPFGRLRENSHTLTLTREALEALGHEFLKNSMNQETSGCNLIKGK